MCASLAIPLALGAAGFLTGCSKPTRGADRSGPTPPTAPAVRADPRQWAILATLPAPYRLADLYNGQAKFALCRSCHTTARAAGAAFGPNLWEVFGRRSGSAPGYAYSEGLRRLAVTWTPQTVDAWIANPRAVVPGTKMAYAGLEDHRDRVDVVAYLATVTTPSPGHEDAAGR